MSFLLKMIAQDDATAKVKKVTGEVERLSRATQKSSFIAKEFSKSWSRGAGDLVKGFIGFQAASKAVDFLAGSVKIYLDTSKDLIALQTKAELADVAEGWKQVQFAIGEGLTPALKEALELVNKLMGATGIVRTPSVINAEIAKTKQDMEFLKRVIAVTKDTGAGSEGWNARVRMGAAQMHMEGLQAELKKDNWKGIDLVKEETGSASGKAVAGVVGWGTVLPEHQAQMEMIQNNIKLDEQQAEAHKNMMEIRTKVHQRHMDEQKKESDMRKEALGSTISNSLAIADMFKEKSEGMFAMAKALAIAQATMNTYEGASKAVGQFGVFSPLVVGSIIALGMAQVAQIAATEYKGGLAKGTSYAEGGRYMVGESGPEMVTLPRGASVTPNHKLAGVNITINGTGDQRWIQDTLVPVLKRELSRN